MFQVEAYDFDLPSELIAQEPQARRSEARLMLVDRNRGAISHYQVRDLPHLLEPQDLLVLNNTRVFPARLFARGKNRPIEILLLRRVGKEQVWDVLARPGKRLKPGRRLIFGKGELEATVQSEAAGPVRRLDFRVEGDFWQAIERVGVVPLPPYIRRTTAPEDRRRYQTVFGEIRGSVAAPTAGLHFDQQLLADLSHCFVTLHVGYGTFKPVTASDIRGHTVDPEIFQVSRETGTLLNRQLGAEESVVAVGTTTTRVLEHLGRQGFTDRETIGETDLYILPGFEFQVTGKLMTNFHLPKSSLMFLVSAFAGRELLLEAYQEAISARYHFYSYGDAMLIV